MKIIIAKINDLKGKKVEAFRIMDLATGKCADISYYSIKKWMVSTGEEVMGLRLIERTDYKDYSSKLKVIATNGKFNMAKVPEINGKGELVDTSDAKLLTVYGWKGFAENKTYLCFDYKGNKVELDRTSFNAKVAADEINGAHVSVKNTIVICPELNKEYESRTKFML